MEVHCNGFKFASCNAKSALLISIDGLALPSADAEGFKFECPPFFSFGIKPNSFIRKIKSS